jgi:aminoglycoside phosphotransferase (APT) family kinase protein
MATHMPPAEVDITTALVRSLLAAQRPDLAGSEVRLLANGWDNVLFRVGGELVARLPRRAIAANLIENEARWLPELGSSLPLAIPIPLFVGEPGDGYPWKWALVPWIPGTPVGVSEDFDPFQAAEDMGQFLRALHRPAPPQAPENPYRGIPLADRAEATRERIEKLGALVDQLTMLRVWESALATPEFDGEPAWLHGDLHPNNLLASGGRLSGVIDFGDITSGDPATDLSIIWMLLPTHLHSIFRGAYGGVDDDAWERARGWGLSLATAYLAHSADNPAMAAIGSTTIDRLLRDS